MQSKDTIINLPKGVPPLTSLYFYIAGSCNLACKHCWIAPEFKENPDKESFLPLEYIKSAIIQAKPLGLRSVKLTGGEPLLHPQFKEILTFIRKENLPCPIETNGVLLDKDMAQFLASEKSKPFVSISIDGSNAKTHEDLRGVKGSFQKSINAVKYLVKNGIKPQIICSLHKNNVTEIEEVVKMAEIMDCESVKFNIIQKIGRGNDYNKKYGLTIQKTLAFYRFVEDKVIPRTKIRVIYDIPIAFNPIKRFLNRNLGKCNILNILGILSTGELALCGIGTTISELIYGHLNEDNLNQVWYESPGLVSLRDEIPENFEGICCDCIHKYFCLGTCIANNYSRTGKLSSSYYFCEEANKLGLFPKTRKKIDKGDKDE